MMTLETMTTPTHKLILENSQHLEDHGVILASDVISQIYNYQDDMNWNLRVTTEILKNGETDAFVGSLEECEDNSILAENAGINFRIEKISY